jgi:hypothetical protein
VVERDVGNYLAAILCDDHLFLDARHSPLATPQWLYAGSSARSASNPAPPGGRKLAAKASDLTGLFPSGVIE